MVTADLLAVGFIATVSLICVGLGWLLPRLAPRGEESDVPEGDGDYYALDVPPRLRESRQILRAALEPDDLMDVADATAGPGIEGFSPLEAETFRRNYLPMTDPERARLDEAFRSIMQGVER